MRHWFQRIFLYLLVLSNRWLASFSVTDNMASILSVERSSSEIPCLDGIRFLHTMMLVFAHKLMEITFNPIANGVEVNRFFKTNISVAPRACYLNTDIFLMLSGLLLSYSLIGRLQRGVKINILKEIGGRYFRFMPPVAALIAFATFILPFAGSGPQWNMLITYQSELCKRTWWRNFLMIHNWFGFENICMTHTHHIGTDFELFVFSVLLVVFFYNSPKYGTITMLSLVASSSIGNFLITFNNHIGTYVLFGSE